VVFARWPATPVVAVVITHGHRCAQCECEWARAVALQRYRLCAAWGLATFVGSLVVWAVVLPESWGAWAWLFVLPTWVGLFYGPVWLYRRLLRARAALPAAAVAAYRGRRAS
jgi:hypothetical protein